MKVDCDCDWDVACGSVLIGTVSSLNNKFLYMPIIVKRKRGFVTVLTRSSEYEEAKEATATEKPGSRRVS